MHGRNLTVLYVIRLGLESIFILSQMRGFQKNEKTFDTHTKKIIVLYKTQNANPLSINFVNVFYFGKPTVEFWLINEIGA